MLPEATSKLSVLADAGSIFTQTIEQLRMAFSTAWAHTLEYAPKLVPALIVLVVGYLVARLVARGVVNIGERMGLQRAAEHGELAQSMRHVGIKWSVPQIIGSIVFWSLIFVFLMATFNVLGLTKFFEEPLQHVVNYIPLVLVATFLVVVGLLIATLLKGFIATSADRAGLTYAQQLASGAYYVLAVVTFVAALQFLGIPLGLLNNLILIAAGGVAVGFALAFGLGGRDVVAGILAGYYLRQRMQTGDHVEIGGLTGTVREVGPVATIIETEEAGLMHRHSIPNAKMLNEAVR